MLFKVRTTRARWLLSALLMLVGSAVWWKTAWHRTPESRSPTGASAAPAKGTLSDRYGKGELLTYAVELKSSLAIDHDRTLMDVTLAGRWEAHVLSATRDATEISTRLLLDRLQSTGSDGQPAELTPEQQAAFATPLTITLDANGMITQTRADASLSGMADGVVRSIAAQLQVDRRALEEPELSRVEHDASGRCEVRYTRLDERQLVKEKLRYQEVLGFAGQRPATQLELDVEQSRAEYVWHGRRIGTLSLREEITTQGTGLPPMRAITALDLKLLSRTHRAPPGLAQGSPALPIYGRNPIDRELHALRMQRLHDVSVNALVQRLHGLDSKQGSDRADVFASLRDVLRYNKGAIDDLLRRLRNDDPEPVFLIAALAAAGTPEAQAALIELFDEQRFDPNTQREIVRGLSFVDAPTADTVSKLQSLMDDPLLGRQATYGVGTVANHLRAHDPEQADELVSYLRDGLEHASDDTERVNYVKALGNAASDDALPQVHSALLSTSPAVRAQALRALRLMPEGRADELLAHNMLADQELQVRATAVRAVRHRTPTETVGRALLDLVQSERSQVPLHEAYKVLRAWGDSAPHVLEAKTWVRARETDPKALALLGDAS